ncbi:MAG: outer membrane beta-barrel protein, partial [Oscillibacter sp.]|nr:outer membrane beta-barrel protein [Oscillibacter sp.]
MGRYILCFAFCIWLCGVVRGQTAGTFVIQGQVVEKDSREPLPYATVALTQLPDIAKIIKGVVTDDTGHFKLTALKNAYYLIVRNVGFRNFVKKLTPDMEDNIDLGVIELQVEPEMLGMVTVKPLVEVSADQITYNLMADPDREKSSLHAILDKVPLIERNIKGDLYVGDEGKKFLVVRNGKVDALFDGNINDLLKSIPARGFATVTVLLAPPERYGDYDYVVNITTDKSAQLYGAVGMVQGVGQVNDGLFDSDAGIMSSLNKVRLNVSGGLDLKNAPERKNSIVREQKKEGSLLVQEEKINTSGEKWGIGGVLSQDISKEHFINWRIGYGKQYDRDKRCTESQWDEQPKEITNFIKRESMRPLYGAIEYQYDIGKTQKVLNVAYQLDLRPKEKEDFGGANGLATTERMQEQALQVHYYNPFKKGFRLETGASYIYRNNSQKVSQGGIVNNSLEENKHIVSAYGRLNYSHKRFSAFLALKAEYLNDGDGTVQITGGKEEKISLTGLHWMPEASVSWVLSKKNYSRLNLSYSIRHFRPSLKLLSVYEDFSTPNMIIKGNPKLKEEDHHSLNLSLNIAKWNIFCSWNHSGNKIGAYWYQDEQQR